MAAAASFGRAGRVGLSVGAHDHTARTRQRLEMVYCTRLKTAGRLPEPRRRPGAGPGQRPCTHRDSRLNHGRVDRQPTWDRYRPVEGHGSLRAFGLGRIQLPPIETMDDFNVILRDMLPLQGEDLTGPHAGEQRQSDDQLFADIEDMQNLLNLFGREHASGWRSNGRRREQQFGGIGREDPHPERPSGRSRAGPSGGDRRH